MRIPIDHKKFVFSGVLNEVCSMKVLKLSHGIMQEFSPGLIYPGKVRFKKPFPEREIRRCLFDFSCAVAWDFSCWQCL